MRYMFTTTPDEGCREVEAGIYGRPVHTDLQVAMRKRGWSFTVDSLRGKTDGLRQKEEEWEESQEVSDDSDLWADLYEEKFGKRPHHKMKLETIISKVEADD